MPNPVSRKQLHHYLVSIEIFLKDKNRRIPNISPGLIEVRKHIWGAYIRGAYIRRGIIFGGHFVLVSEYQDFKIHCCALIL